VESLPNGNFKFQIEFSIFKPQMMLLPLIPLFMYALALTSCMSASSVKSENPVNAKTSCPGDLYMEATGTGKSIDLASSNAKAQIVSNIVSKVEYQSNTDESSNENEGKLDESSSYSASSQIKSNLTLLVFRPMEPPKQRPDDSLYEYKGYVCNSDVAMLFLDSLRNYEDALEELKRQKLDKDACGRAVKTRENMRQFETLLAILKQADKAQALKYDKVYEEIKNDCGLEASKKLHWNPEKQNEYSKIAFNKLSTGIKMETSPCKGKGISLIFKGEPECKSNGGPYGCLYQPSLQMAYCDGTEIRPLKSPVIKSFDQKQDMAEIKLQDKLKAEDFWNEWEQEIKHRSQ